MTAEDYQEELLLTLRTRVLEDVVPEFPFITEADVHVEDPDPRYIQRVEDGDTSAAVALEIVSDQPSPRFVEGELYLRESDTTSNTDLVVADKRIFSVECRVYARRRRWKRLLARRLERYFEDNEIIPCVVGDTTTGNSIWIMSVAGRNVEPEDDFYVYILTLTVEGQELEDVTTQKPSAGVEITLGDYDEGG
ncbi:MAG: hypothetical protein PVH29_12375 [Candidatus Zixiibacteriota bacterium]|jgi:hypothetical protein